MALQSSCVQGAYKRLVLQYEEGAGLAKAAVNDKVKRKPKEHMSKIIL
jgi:hypothetical protein